MKIELYIKESYDHNCKKNKPGLWVAFKHKHEPYITPDFKLASRYYYTVYYRHGWFSTNEEEGSVAEMHELIKTNCSFSLPLSHSWIINKRLYFNIFQQFEEMLLKEFLEIGNILNKTKVKLITKLLVLDQNINKN